MSDGCSYGKVTRTIVLDIRDDIKEIKEKVENIDKSTLEMFNHMTEKLQAISKGKLDWKTVLIITLLSNVCVGLIIEFLKN